MSDERTKHRISRLIPDTKVIDSAEAGSDPDVEVFALDDSGPRPDPAALVGPGGHKLLEEARTTEWSAKELRAELSAPLQRSKQVTGSIEVEPAPAAARNADSALIRAGQSAVTARRSAPPEDPIESTPTDPRGSDFIEAYPTDPIIEQGYFDEQDPQDRAQRLRLEAPLQIEVKAVQQISPDPKLRVITASSSQAAEQYRVLSLKLKEGRSIRRVVAVTAPTAESEGPILAANLALALAEGRRTQIALVDADLRGGRLAELFDLTQGPGLADQLRSHRKDPELPWTMLAVTNSLHFIPAGAAVKNPSSLLNAEVLGELFGELRRSYDFIILCTPPVTESADVNILQEHVDGALLVVRAGVTKKESITASITRLGTRKFIGAVLCEV